MLLGHRMAVARSCFLLAPSLSVDVAGPSRGSQHPRCSADRADNAAYRPRGTSDRLPDNGQARGGTSAGGSGNISPIKTFVRHFRLNRARAREARASLNKPDRPFISYSFKRIEIRLSALCEPVSRHHVNVTSSIVLTVWRPPTSVCLLELGAPRRELRANCRELRFTLALAGPGRATGRYKRGKTIGLISARPCHNER